MKRRMAVLCLVVLLCLSASDISARTLDRYLPQPNDSIFLTALQSARAWMGDAWLAMVASVDRLGTAFGANGVLDEPPGYDDPPRINGVLDEPPGVIKDPRDP